MCAIDAADAQMAVDNVDVNETHGDDAVHNSQDDESTNQSSIASILVTVNWRRKEWELEFPEDAPLEALFYEVNDSFKIALPNQKFIIPKSPLLKWPLKEPKKPLSDLAGKQITLMGSPREELEAFDKMSERVALRNQMRLRRTKPLSRRAGGIHTASDASYTFLQIKPLDWLPRPERSQKLLMKLAQDPGIVSVMRKRKFTVGLLTEMEPLQHTQSSHEGTSRTLGLNRNKGEAIELRLRTDAHDGYRDYKTIRKTLCHELTHNVHSEHDSKFWALCSQIEKEVAAADWKSGGHSIGETSRYTISGLGDDDEDDDMHADDGGWQGGEFVLGGARSKSSGSQPTGWSRREILANAAMERQKKDDESECKAEKGWRPCKRSSGDESS